MNFITIFCIYNDQINLEKTNNMILTVSNSLWKNNLKKINLSYNKIGGNDLCIGFIRRCNVCLERIWEKDCIIEKKNQNCVTNLLKHICTCEIEVARVCWKYRVRFNITRPLPLLPLHVLDSLTLIDTYVTPAVMNIFNILVVVCEFFCSIGTIQCALIISNFTNSFELIK